MTETTGPASRIYRYEVPIDDRWHEIELCGDPLHVASRRMETCEFWALSSESLPSSKRRFTVVGTGHPLPDLPLRHWGTAVHEYLVWHLIEDTTEAATS